VREKERREKNESAEDLFWKEELTPKGMPLTTSSSQKEEERLTALSDGREKGGSSLNKKKDIGRENKASKKGFRLGKIVSTMLKKGVDLA